MLIHKLPRWAPILVLVAWPVACATVPHTFSNDTGASAGDAGTEDGNSGASTGGQNAHAGSSNAGAGRSNGAGDAGDGAGGGDAGAGPAGGSAPTGGGGGSAPIAGSSGAATGGSSGAATGGTSGGTAGAPSAGSGGANAGAGGAAAVAPAVTLVTPANGAMGVRSDATVVIQFNQAMDKLFTQGAFSSATLPSGSFSWSADAKTMTFTPGTAFAYATGTNPAAVSAKVYSYTLASSAQSADGTPLASAKSVAFSTARQIAVNIYPSELWDVTSAGTSEKCDASGDCDAFTVGDTAANVIERGVFRYDATLPSGAFVQDLNMYVTIEFGNGSVTTLGAMQVAKTTGIVYATSPAAATFSYAIGSTGTTTSTFTNASALLTNGSFGTADLYLSVLWSAGTDSDGNYDDVFVNDGHLALHYLIP